MTKSVLKRAAEQKLWRHFIIIAIPFLFVVVFSDWMATPFTTFHGSDEPLYHYPTIRHFYEQLPQPDFSNYNSATGPLFHVLFALIAKVVGLDLQALRLVNVLLSLLAVFFFYDLVARLTDRTEALFFTLLFALSPYFFGASFTLLTDNLGILFALLALRILVLAPRPIMPMQWAGFCGWLCLATLTRQTYIWLGIGALAAMFVDSEPLQRRALKIAGVAAACVPLLGLIASWHGMTPPMFQQRHVASSLLNLRAGIFGVCVFGLYWLALFPDRFLAAVKRLPKMNPILLAASILAAPALLLLEPLTLREGDYGVLWRVTRMLPSIAGTGLLFWILLPPGLLFFREAARSRDRITRTLLPMAIAFLVCSMPNVKINEKYYDPLIILLIILIEFRAGSPSTLSTISRPLLLVGFICFSIIATVFPSPQ
jgi:4-amino-4-deoxy-L-arabinose transferase-like glycosyltransferase